jgi:hypothetical protein
MRTDIFCFYLQNRLVQTSQTGGQQYSDTSPFSIPCLSLGFSWPKGAQNTFLSMLKQASANIKEEQGENLRLETKAEHVTFSTD